MKWLFVPVLFLFLSTDLLAQVAGKDQSGLEAELKEIKESQAKESEALKEEIRKLRLELVVPETEYGSYSGLGPAASKVYFTPKGLSIGGYGEFSYEHFVHGSKTDRGDTFRFIPYFGYKFTEKIIMNTELEFEHAGIKDISEKEPEVYVEFMYLDFLLHPAFNIRPGLILVPSSRVNEYHEPTVFYGVFRPDVERFIVPSVWRELGIMFYGKILESLSYKAAVMNGLRTDTIKDWIGGGRQRGAEVNFNKAAGVFRLDFSPAIWLNIGGFAYYGQGEDKKGAAEIGGQSANFSLFGAEAQAEWKGLWVKGFFAYGASEGNDKFEQEEEKNRSKEVYGWYFESAFNLLSLFAPDTLASLNPFVRYEKYNLHSGVFEGHSADPSKNRDVLTFGIDFKPHPQVVIKLDYQLRDTASDLSQGKGKGGDGNERDEFKIDQFNIGAGFIF